jgi:hypothetical protein
MFAPDGFSNWFEIQRELERISHDTFHSIKDLDVWAGTKEKRIRLFNRIRDSAWHSFVETSDSFGVVSTDGLFLRINSFHISLKMQEITIDGSTPRPFVFIDDTTGLVDSSPVSARILAAEKMLDFHTKSFPPELADTVTLSEDEWADLEILVDARNYLNVFEKLDGRAICCREEDSPQWVLDGFVERHKNYIPPEEASIAPINYFDYMADNRSGRSVTAISKEIVKLADDGSTMRKQEYKLFLCPDVSHRHFNRAWEMAADERPELRKPGRRPENSKRRIDTLS